MQKLSQPHKILNVKGLIQTKSSLSGGHGLLGNTGALKHLQRISCKTHDGIVDQGNPDQGRYGNQKPFYNIFFHLFFSTSKTAGPQAARWVLPGRTGSRG